MVKVLSSIQKAGNNVMCLDSSHRCATTRKWSLQYDDCRQLSRSNFLLSSVVSSDHAECSVLHGVTESTLHLLLLYAAVLLKIRYYTRLRTPQRIRLLPYTPRTPYIHMHVSIYLPKASSSDSDLHCILLLPKRSEG